jgi:hypothetical protein
MQSLNGRPPSIDAGRIKKIQDRAQFLWGAEVVVMFSGLFLAAGGGWFQLAYYLVATALAICVLWTAYLASQYIPVSFRFQRQLGGSFYLVGHFLQFFFPGQLPMALVAVQLVICPLAMLFLFE